MDPKFVEGLRGAKKLFDEGIFTQEEFTQEKQKLVTERDERQAASIRCPNIIEEQGGIRHFNAITGFTCQRQSYLVVRECNSLLCWFKSPPAHAREPPKHLRCERACFPSCAGVAMCDNCPGVFLEQQGKQDGRKWLASSASSDNLAKTVEACQAQKKSKACPRADTTSADKGKSTPSHSVIVPRVTGRGERGELSVTARSSVCSSLVILGT